MLPGASPALGSTSPGPRAYSARISVLPGHFPSPWFCEPRCARLLPASPSLQLPPLAACAPPRLCRCSCLRSLPVRRRFSATAAASAMYSVFCAVFCSLLSAPCVFCAALCVAISLRCVRFPQFAICTLCSVTCAVPSGSCQPGCARAKLLFFRVRSPALSLHVQAVGSRGLIT